MSLFLAAPRAGSSSSSSSAGSSSSISAVAALSLSLRSLHLSASRSAAAKKGVKPQVKKKTAIKKTTSGPRGGGGGGGGAKGRRGGLDAAAARTNPFFVAPAPPKLPLLTPAQYAGAEERVGEAFAWSKCVRDLHTAGVMPKGISREFASQPTPRTILRPLSLSLFSSLDSLSGSGRTPSAPRMLVGPRGVGKSHVLLQCVAHALESGWIVLYIPRGIGMINSTSPFAYVASQQTYAQRALSQSVAANLASQVALGDVAVLDLPLETDLPRSSARELAAHLANHAAALSPSALAGGLHLLLLSLAAQTKTPMLLAIDDAQALYMRSAYKDADARPLEAWQLSLPRSLLSLLDSHKIQRGATLAALGLSTSEYRPPAALLRALGREELHGCNTGYTPLNAYSAVDATHEQHARAAGWKCVEVGNLQAREAKGMWDVKRMEGATWNVANDELFVAKLLESGGNARLFERSLLHTSV